MIKKFLVYYNYHLLLEVKQDNDYILSLVKTARQEGYKTQFAPCRCGYQLYINK